MSWRKNIFTEGAIYRSKKTFLSGPSAFTQDELLKFERDSYSHYDSSSVFQFTSETTKELKGWWLHNDESVDIWREYFEEAITNESSKYIQSQQSNAHQDLVYEPAKDLAEEVGKLGLKEWQVKVEDLIRFSNSSTEIFMGLRWHLDELLRSEFVIPSELRKRAVKLRDEVHKALQVT